MLWQVLVVSVGVGRVPMYAEPAAPKALQPKGHAMCVYSYNL
jgi:hypothetical protein